MPNLIHRLCRDLGLPSMAWKRPLRYRNSRRESVIRHICDVSRGRAAEAILIVCDADRACPRQLGPRMSGWVAEAQLPFPAAVVLLCPEYEVLFLPCIHLMAGRTLRNERGGLLVQNLRQCRRLDSPFEAKRGVKELVTKTLFPQGYRYKPNLHQLPMTRLLDFATLRASRLPCFGTLERALCFLATHRGRGGVYPPPAAYSPS